MIDHQQRSRQGSGERAKKVTGVGKGGGGLVSKGVLGDKWEIDLEERDGGTKTRTRTRKRKRRRKRELNRVREREGGFASRSRRGDTVSFLIRFSSPRGRLVMDRLGKRSRGPRMV